MFGQPVRVSFTEQRQVVEFVVKFAAFPKPGRERAEFGGRELMLLQFAEQLAELLRETRPAGALPEKASVPVRAGATTRAAP